MVGLILSGGENRRMGADKGLLRLNGKTFIEIITSKLERYFKDIYISTNVPEDYFCFGFDMIGDIFESRGPMTGILSGMIGSRASEVFVVACDMPFISEGVIEILMRSYVDQDAVIPVFRGREYPLPGIYSARLISIMEKRVGGQETGMKSLIKDIRVHYCSEDIPLIDPNGRSFINLNTPDDINREIGGQICLA